MNLQRIRAMARKEWWHLLRDPRSLALILLMPSMLLFLFGYALSLDGVDDYVEFEGDPPLGLTGPVSVEPL